MIRSFVSLYLTAHLAQDPCVCVGGVDVGLSSGGVYLVQRRVRSVRQRERVRGYQAHCSSAFSFGLFYGCLCGRRAAVARTERGGRATTERDSVWQRRPAWPRAHVCMAGATLPLTGSPAEGGNGTHTQKEEEKRAYSLLYTLTGEWDGIIHATCCYGIRGV